MAGVTNALARSSAIDAYLTHVADAVAKEGILQDATSRSCPTLGELTAGGRTVTWDGGRTMNVDLMYDFTAGFAAIGPWDPITLTGSDGITQAMYPTAQYVIPVAIDGPAIRDNMGQGKLADLVKNKFKQANMTQKNRLSQHLFDIANVSTTTTGTGGKQMIPLPMLVSKANTVYPGGINPGTYTWWDNPREAGDATTTTAAATTYKTHLDKMDAVGMLASKYMGGMPDIVVCDLKTYLMTIRAMRNLQQMVDPVTGESGFRGVKIGTLGGAKLFWEEHMCDLESGTNFDGSISYGTMFFLNSEYTKLYVRKGMNWKPSPFESLLPRQDVFASAILWEGNLVGLNRLKNSVYYKITQSIAS